MKEIKVLPASIDEIVDHMLLRRALFTVRRYSVNSAPDNIHMRPLKALQTPVKRIRDLGTLLRALYTLQQHKGREEIMWVSVQMPYGFACIPETRAYAEMKRDAGSGCRAIIVEDSYAVVQRMRELGYKYPYL